MAAKNKRKNPAAVSLGRKGGLNSRKNLTVEEAKELGRIAAAARWGTKKKGAAKKKEGKGND